MISFWDRTDDPPTPSAGHLRLYTKNNSLYTIDSDGVITLLANMGGNTFTVQSTAPGSPNSGDVWLDSDDGILYTYNGATWVEGYNPGDTFVPYTGATGNVDLGTHDLSADNVNADTMVSAGNVGATSTSAAITPGNLIAQEGNGASSVAGITITPDYGTHVVNYNAAGDAPMKHAFNADMEITGGLKVSELGGGGPQSVFVDNDGNLSAGASPDSPMWETRTIDTEADVFAPIVNHKTTYLGDDTDYDKADSGKLVVAPNAVDTGTSIVIAGSEAGEADGTYTVYGSTIGGFTAWHNAGLDLWIVIDNTGNYYGIYYSVAEPAAPNYFDCWYTNYLDIGNPLGIYTGNDTRAFYSPVSASQAGISSGRAIRGYGLSVFDSLSTTALHAEQITGVPDTTLTKIYGADANGDLSQTDADWWLSTVTIDGTLTGDGTSASPLGVNFASANTWTEKITTKATTAGGAGLNILSGTAPSSPADGDLWKVLGALYHRYSGATYTLANLESSQSFSGTQTFANLTTNGNTTIGSDSGDSLTVNAVSGWITVSDGTGVRGISANTGVTYLAGGTTASAANGASVRVYGASHATLASKVVITAGTAASGSSDSIVLSTNVTASANLNVNGNTTLGDASGDSVTINAATLTAANIPAGTIASGKNLGLNASNQLVTATVSGGTAKKSYVAQFFRSGSLANNQVVQLAGMTGASTPIGFVMPVAGTIKEITVTSSLTNAGGSVTLTAKFEKFTSGSQHSVGAGTACGELACTYDAGALYNKTFSTTSVTSPVSIAAGSYILPYITISGTPNITDIAITARIEED